MRNIQHWANEILPEKLRTELDPHYLEARIMNVLDLAIPSVLNELRTAVIHFETEESRRSLAWLEIPVFGEKSKKLYDNGRAVFLKVVNEIRIMLEFFSKHQNITPTKAIQFIEKQFTEKQFPEAIINDIRARVVALSREEIQRCSTEQELLEPAKIVIPSQNPPEAPEVVRQPQEQPETQNSPEAPEAEIPNDIQDRAIARVLGELQTAVIHFETEESRRSLAWLEIPVFGEKSKKLHDNERAVFLKAMHEIGTIARFFTSHPNTEAREVMKFIERKWIEKQFPEAIINDIRERVVALSRDEIQRCSTEQESPKPAEIVIPSQNPPEAPGEIVRKLLPQLVPASFTQKKALIKAAVDRCCHDSLLEIPRAESTVFEQMYLLLEEVGKADIVNTLICHKKTKMQEARKKDSEANIIWSGLDEINTLLDIEYLFFEAVVRKLQGNRGIQHSKLLNRFFNFLKKQKEEECDAQNEEPINFTAMDPEPYPMVREFVNQMDRFKGASDIEGVNRFRVLHAATYEAVAKVFTSKMRAYYTEGSTGGFQKIWSLFLHKYSEAQILTTSYEYFSMMGIVRPDKMHTAKLFMVDDIDEDNLCFQDKPDKKHIQMENIDRVEQCLADRMILHAEIIAVRTAWRESGHDYGGSIDVCDVSFRNKLKETPVVLVISNPFRIGGNMVNMAEVSEKIEAANIKFREKYGSELLHLWVDGSQGYDYCPNADAIFYSKRVAGTQSGLLLVNKDYISGSDSICEEGDLEHGGGYRPENLLRIIGMMHVAQTGKAHSLEDLLKKPGLFQAAVQQDTYLQTEIRKAGTVKKRCSYTHSQYFHDIKGPVHVKYGKDGRLPDYQKLTSLLRIQVNFGPQDFTNTFRIVQEIWGRNVNMVRLEQVLREQFSLRVDNFSLWRIDGFEKLFQHAQKFRNNRQNFNFPEFHKEVLEFQNKNLSSLARLLLPRKEDMRDCWGDEEKLMAYFCRAVEEHECFRVALTMSNSPGDLSRLTTTIYNIVQKDYEAVKTKKNQPYKTLISI